MIASEAMVSDLIAQVKNREAVELEVALREARMDCVSTKMVTVTDSLCLELTSGFGGCLTHSDPNYALRATEISMHGPFDALKN